jgi:hypothetical protein
MPDPLTFIAPMPRLRQDGATWVSVVRRLETQGFPHRPRVRCRVARGGAHQPCRDRFPATCGGRRRSPAKQGRRMPGADIPIVSPDELLAAKRDQFS